MITISDALNGYLNNTTRLEGQYVRIDIRTKTGTSYSISDDELRGGTVKIEKKSVSGSSFDIGECYINNATITIIDKENKYPDNFNNAEMSIFFGVRNASLGLDEEIQLGKFIIPTDTTIRKIASIQLVGDSILSKLDKPINGVTTSGKPYALVSWCCDECGVELALTEAEFNALSKNTDYTFYISEESSIETYRDVIMYVSQIIGGFATDTNDGKLTFKTYTVSNPTFNINNDTIASSKLGDSSYKLDGMTIQFNNKVLYIQGDNNSVYTLNLESNPLFENLDEDLVVIICNNIWEQLKDLTFRSFDFQYNGNPAIECGDILNNDVRGFSSFITSISWVYHKKSSVIGAFLDKRTKTQSQGIKKASTTGGGGSSNELSILKYINTEEYRLSTLETKVLQEYFNVPANSSPLFSFVMITKTELTGLVTIRIVYDNVEVLLKPKFQCSLGYHTLTFTKSLDPADTDKVHSLAVYATFIEDAGQQIESITPCLVEMYNIEANILGWKVSSGKPDWIGTYELTDEFRPLSIPNFIKIVNFTDNVTTNIAKPIIPTSTSDSFAPIKLHNVINMLDFTSNIEVSTEVYVPPVLVTDLLAKDATLSGTATLRDNSNVTGNKDISNLGLYPDNSASWTISPTTDLSKVEISVTASSTSANYSVCLYLDGTQIVKDLSINSNDSYRPVEVFAETISMTAGSHTLAISRGSTNTNAPYVASINIKGWE